MLRKKSKEITEINDRIRQLLDDMVETMQQANGVGLAAPQVGILRRAIVIDTGEQQLKAVNPEIIEVSGSIVDVEGCLSIPGISGTVERPEKIKVRYLDENGKEKIIEASSLLARVFCHEIDHLEGILYTDKVIETFNNEELEEE